MNDRLISVHNRKPIFSLITYPVHQISQKQLLLAKLILYFHLVPIARKRKENENWLNKKVSPKIW